MSKRGFARLTMLSAVAVASLWALPAGASAQAVFTSSFNDNSETTTDSFNTTIDRICTGGDGGNGGTGAGAGTVNGGSGGTGGTGVTATSGTGNVGLGGNGAGGGAGGSSTGGDGGNGGAGGDVDCSNTSNSNNRTVAGALGADEGSALTVGGVPLAQTGFDAWIFALLGGLFLAGGIALLAAQRPGGIRRR